jgi:hypothetical protein
MNSRVLTTIELSNNMNIRVLNAIRLSNFLSERCKNEDRLIFKENIWEYINDLCTDIKASEIVCSPDDESEDD